MLSSLQNRYFSAFWTMRKKSAAVQQQVPWEWGSIKCPENVVQLLWYKVQTSSLLLGHALYFFLVGVGNFPEFMKSWQFFHHWEVNLLLVNNCISWMFLIIICLVNSICILGYCTRKLECGLKVEQSLAVDTSRSTITSKDALVIFILL